MLVLTKLVINLRRAFKFSSCKADTLQGLGTVALAYNLSYKWRWRWEECGSKPVWAKC
jgi:hypothetical protein